MPPRFALTELDDSTAGAVTPGVRRVLFHWNGLVGEPAEQVLLGWSNGRGAEVVVATRVDDGRWPMPSALRLDALYLGGVGAIEEGLEPLMGLDQWRLAHRGVDGENGDWVEAPVPVAGECSGAQVLAVDSGLVGAVLRDALVMSFSIRGLDLRQIALRAVTLETAAAYDRNPLQPAADR